MGREGKKVGRAVCAWNVQRKYVDRDGILSKSYARGWMVDGKVHNVRLIHHSRPVSPLCSRIREAGGSETKVVHTLVVMNPAPKKRKEKTRTWPSLNAVKYKSSK